MRCAVDVDYRTIVRLEPARAIVRLEPARAIGVATACVTFAAWDDARPASERVVVATEPAAAYESGAFYRRELPYLLAVLDGLAPNLVIVDGHVWLAGGQPGLGAHLHAALAGRAAIVGVAKRPFAGAAAVPVLRGAGANPLYVSAVGIDVGEAVAGLRAMHGPFRIPTLLKRVDRLCRDAR